MNQITQVVFANTDNYKGYVDPRFIDLAKQFSRLQDQRSQLGGAALAVFFQGEKVVDIYTGMKSANEEWTEDTLSICYSTGKGVLATLAHILVSHGFLKYDQLIGEYWPEFAQNGKEKMTLRHILSHQSGLFDIRNMIASASEMADWSHMLQVMEKARPRFNIGQENAYQALTFGWLVGGILEKATQKSLANLMQSYLIEPLNLDGAYFGVPNEQLSRVAKPLPKLVNTHPRLRPKQNKPTKSHKFNLTEKVIQWSGQNPQDFLDAMVPKHMREFSFFDDATMQTAIPAANGAFTARSLAKIYAMMANHGEWEGRDLVDDETFQVLTKIQNYKRDRVMPIPMKWRLGYHRVLSMGKRAKNGFGHIGYNGSGAWCDPDRNLSFAYTHNFAAGSITGDYRLWGLTQETLRCADAVLKGHKGWF